MFPILPAGSAGMATTSLPAFVIAHDGLYLRKQSLLGVSQTKVDGIEHLPVEKEFVEYALPKIPADLMARIVGFFRSIYRRQATEALVLLLWADAGFDCFVPAQKVSPVSVSHTLDETELPLKSRVIGSIHSHGAFGAWASSIDAADEAAFDGLHVVVGNFDRARPTYSAALALDGQRFDIPTHVVLERPRRLVEPPEDWLRQVKLLPPPRPSRSKGKGTGSNGAMASVPGTLPTGASRVDLDVALVRALGLADKLGLHFSYQLVPREGSSRKGGGADD